MGTGITPSCDFAALTRDSYVLSPTGGRAIGTSGLLLLIIPLDVDNQEAVALSAFAMPAQPQPDSDFKQILSLFSTATASIPRAKY
jgi:hypothetical protein